jgi:hypothetical protein
MSDREKNGIWGEISETFWRLKGGNVMRSVKEIADAGNNLLRHYDMA